jgi:hypothetical protein
MKYFQKKCLPPFLIFNLSSLAMNKRGIRWELFTTLKTGNLISWSANEGNFQNSQGVILI